MFEYLTKTVTIDQLQVFLSEKGRDGWRLHTCEPLHDWLGSVVTTNSVLVVMDRIAQKEEPEEETPGGEPEAMACRG